MAEAEARAAAAPLERGWVASWFAALAAAVLLTFLLGLLVGSYPVTPAGLVRWLSGTADPTLTQILGDVRLPRVLTTIVAGGALGLTGPLLQSAFRTPLADPYLLGLAGFGALGAVILQGMGWGGFGPAVLAVLGSLLAAWLVATLAGEASAERRALVGIALAAVSLAGLAMALALGSSVGGAGVVGWVVGGFYARSWPQLWAVLPIALPAALAALAVGRAANLLQLGDDVAENLGLRARAARAGLIGLAAVLTGVAVGTAGLLGFVGLLSAGAARGLFGTDYRRLLPGACLLGMLAVALSDLVGRTLLAPNELPAGAFTTVLGGVYLVSLTRRNL
ncbi:MAG TPA: iron ABC transporter permease [Deinococcales bacterium]|nr:iron ABC transporter permease [Deinococcales bacterium]